MIIFRSVQRTDSINTVDPVRVSISVTISVVTIAIVVLVCTGSIAALGLGMLANAQQLLSLAEGLHNFKQIPDRCLQIHILILYLLLLGDCMLDFTAHGG